MAVVLLVQNTTAQAPNKISYQAVVRDNAGAELVNQSVNFRFCIREGSALGTIVYQEIQALTTNAQGLVQASIGAGTVTSGSFSSVNWSGQSQYLQVDMNPGTGWIWLGTQQMQSVPYALYANDIAVRTSVTGDSLFIGQGNAILIPGLSAANHVLGCTSPSACNYNALATDDDGSCHSLGQSCDDGNAQTSNDVYTTGCVCQGTSNYMVGALGQAGGYVFYDKGSYSNGWRYLEVYPTSFSGIWGCQGTSVSGLSSAVGSGDVNTAAIVAACSAANAVARLADNYTVNGYSDWYLPNAAEMNLIHDNLVVLGIGNIPGPFHWTSSQNSAIYGVLYDFDFDFSDIQSKSTNISGIPVRKF